ncbi:MAG: outer membrane protein assembly factor BamB [Burkholderiales bacterium PBB4]|nr:MAG: outer membrane protein assembly factor BamB [Burkholderiales bacterium PBB4]
MRSAMVAKVWMQTSAAVFVVMVLAGCAGSEKAKMADLTTNPSSMGVKAAWSSTVGGVGFPLDIRVHGTHVYVAGTDGLVAAIDGRTGGDLWRTTSKPQLTAGVGSDGRIAAVVNRSNELVALDAGREVWRQKLTASSLTAPLVAGERIFVLTGDRSVVAFDATTGRRLWQQQRPGEALVLQQAGVIQAIGDTLVVGFGGRLLGLNPQTGAIRWDTPVASSRGTNEVERLVDLVAGVSRSGDQVCTRAFQSAVSCIDANRGTAVWTKSAAGSTGIGGDADVVYGTESNGAVVAWRRSDGDKLWANEQLKNRSLTTPLLVGRALVVGDAAGYLHFLSRDNGATLNRVTTDGSPVVAGPVLAGQTIVVVTRRGGVFGFRPE